MPYLPSLGSRATLLDVFRSFPETSKPLIEYHEVLLRGSSPFTEAQRELIAAYVSGLNHCRYCHGVHIATAERLGIEEGPFTGCFARLTSERFSRDACLSSIDTWNAGVTRKETGARPDF